MDWVWDAWTDPHSLQAIFNRETTESFLPDVWFPSLHVLPLHSQRQLRHGYHQDQFPGKHFHLASSYSWLTSRVTSKLIRSWFIHLTNIYWVLLRAWRKLWQAPKDAQAPLTGEGRTTQFNCFLCHWPCWQPCSQQNCFRALDPSEGRIIMTIPSDSAPES